MSRSYETAESTSPIPRGVLVRAHESEKSATSINPLDVPEVRAKFLKKVVPSSLIPMATANAMLILGSSKSDADCSFDLPLYLVWTGTISLALVIAGTVGRYVVRWILEDNKVRPGDKIIMWMLEAIGIVLVLTQVAMLLGGTLYVFPKLPYWQYKYDSLPNYCDFGMVLFVVLFLIIAWVMLLIIIGSAIFIVCYSNVNNKPTDYRFTKTYFYEELA